VLASFGEPGGRPLKTIVAARLVVKPHS
jgi:hypothetical protein